MSASTDSVDAVLAPAGPAPAETSGMAVKQATVDGFAEIAGDRQPTSADPERARRGLFGWPCGRRQRHGFEYPVCAVAVIARYQF